MNSHYVYLILDGDVPFYVGKSHINKNGIDRRWKTHLELSKKETNNPRSRLPVHCKMRKMINENGPLLFEKVAFNMNETQANGVEIALIAHFGRRQNGGILLNLTDGGEGQTGYKPTKDVVKKIAAKRRGTRRTKEACVATSESLKKCYLEGRRSGQSGMTGKTHSPETIAKMKKSAEGRDLSNLHTPEMVAKSAKSRKGLRLGQKLPWVSERWKKWREDHGR